MPLRTSASSRSAERTLPASKTPSTPGTLRTSTGPRSHGCGRTSCSASHAGSVARATAYCPSVPVGVNRIRSRVSTDRSSKPLSWVRSPTTTS